MSRITNDQVHKIIKTDLDDISMFKETAEIIVNEELLNKGLSDKRLEKIELYLTAHFITLREKQLRSEKLGDATNVYFVQTGMNLKASPFGQTALALDSSGSLVNVGNYKSKFEIL